MMKCGSCVCVAKYAIFGTYKMLRKKKTNRVEISAQCTGKLKILFLLSRLSTEAWWKKEKMTNETSSVYAGKWIRNVLKNRTIQSSTVFFNIIDKQEKK